MEKHTSASPYSSVQTVGNDDVRKKVHQMGRKIEPIETIATTEEPPGRPGPGTSGPHCEGGRKSGRSLKKEEVCASFVTDTMEAGGEKE